MAKNAIFNTVEEAIEDFREGRIVIVVDDEDRENEGDFIVAAEKITPEIVNFMLSNGRGVLCAPLSESRCEELELNMMEENNTSLLGTPFTVTVDLLGNVAPRASRSTTAPPRSVRWPIPPPVRRIWGVRAMSIRCVPARRGCCAGRGIPRRR